MSESTRSRTNNSETIVHEEIINLIDSPELREHLLHNPQLLHGDHYMQIVGGAPVEITRKRELLGRLVADGCNSSDDTLYWHYRQICIDYIDGCLDALKAVDGNKLMLLVSDISFIDNEVGSAITHGPFPVASWADALAAMKAYAEKWSGMTDLSSSYWMIELFNLANDPSCSYPYDGFLQPDYTYYANASGEIQYICREEGGECGEVLDCIVGGIFGPWFKGAYEPDAVARIQGEKSNAALAGRIRGLASNRAGPDRRPVRRVRRQQRERAQLAGYISASLALTEDAENRSDPHQQVLPISQFSIRIFIDTKKAVPKPGTAQERESEYLWAK